MRKIFYKEIVDAVSKLCLDAAYNLPSDVCSALETAQKNEQNDTGREILSQCVENFNIARDEQVPICQDTGFAVYFVEVGNEVFVDGGLLNNAITDGTVIGYRDGYLRKSIVSDPLYDRINTKDNTPAVIHTKVITGNSLKITLAPKGGGSENMSAVKMLKPSDGELGVVDFVANTVINSGGNPCPPTIVGVGIGGTFEKCALLAKEALLRPLGTKNSDKRYAELESKILEKINASQVGPQGLGGDTTAFSVHVNFWPCHLASLPVAVNINCHAARHSEVVL